jgi:NTE family protein
MAKEVSKAAITRDPILVDLALQGGGSHGAFTWGVLDRLLEEPWLGIDGISGTSAGAMNAAVLVDGHAKGGAAGARTALESFWFRISEAARFSPLRRGPLDVILGRWTLDSSPIYVAMDLLSRLVSPYDLNPMGKNPLRAILAETINFERLARAPIKLFITCLKTSSLSLVSAAHLSIALVTRRALQEAHRKSGQGGPREAGSNGCLISIGAPRSNINSSI